MTRPASGPMKAQSHPRIEDQIAAAGWKGGMFGIPGATDPQIVHFNPAVRPSSGSRPNHLFARECTWNGHWSAATNRIVRFDIDGGQLINRHEVLFEKLHPDESWEDPRIFEHAGRTHLGVAAWYPYPGRYWVNQCHTPLDEFDHATTRHSPIYGKNGKDIHFQHGTEKNWGWFSHGSAVNFVYQVDPHVVVTPAGEHRSETSMPWRYGTLRGGTTPIRIGDEYLAFFHSSIPWKSIPKYGMRMRYFMGAYCFEAKPPFRPTRYTPEYLLVGSENDRVIPGSPAVVFPCGAAQIGDGVLVTFGSNDAECGWVTMGLDQLFAKMAPC